MSSHKKPTCFYLDAQLHERFKKVCVREGESMSEKHEQFEREYVLRHEIGNPQLRLDVPFGVKAEHFCHCGETATHEAWNLEGEKFYLCTAHFIQNRDARLLKKWRQIK